MAAPLVLLLFHFSALGWNIFGVWQNFEVTGTALDHGAHTYGGRWKYLTFINQVLQTIFFGICLLADLAQLLQSSKKGASSFLLQLRDSAFSVLAFPIGMFVVISFWSIYAFDRELVYPKALDSIIPQWLNHSMHTFVLPLLLVELFVCSHQYPSKKKGLFTLSIFCFAYLSWILWIHHASGIWAYPILAKLDSVGLAIFFGASLILMVPLYCLGDFLTRLCWGGVKPSKKKKKKK
ncbi:androgen-induced gene 1 protein [Bombina bombina]|uniref:androgen-induced gene 1 protein n=1 Tax=Bombina bombina TaxID=8345 RepID=UPI00235A8638|nr:androgen-induced gene 1 protein [Bombina bombina]